MYNPIQIPYLLNENYKRIMVYTEEPAGACSDFVICFWDMEPRSNQPAKTRNIIAADGCIDLVVAFDERLIGFSGMSRTDFAYEIETPARFIGARLKPGAFRQLTGLPAARAMDEFLPLEEVFEWFDQEKFFSLPFDQAKVYFREFFQRITAAKKPDQFTKLFDQLVEKSLENTEELYAMIGFGPRQCQRLFATHYGVSPKLVLSIVRFQRCLEILTSGETSATDIMNATGYYDQSHFINDFRRNIGITPRELIRRYRD